MAFVEGLQEAARVGDWATLEALSDQLLDIPHPSEPNELVDYLFQLRACLVTARTTRADLVKSLHRLTAASRFNQSS
jgi:hypothetical protein